MSNIVRDLLRRFADRQPRGPVYECGYAYPDHSPHPHYHVGHPRRKSQSFTKGTGPYDGDELNANTGVPPNPPGEPNPPLARGFN